MFIYHGCSHSVVHVQQLPDQMLDPRSRKWSRFVSTNGLVADAAAELADEKHIRPWSAEEKRIFCERFLQTPKVSLYCLCNSFGMARSTHAHDVSVPQPWSPGKWCGNCAQS